MTAINKKTIRQLACQFFLIEDKLYKKMYDNMLLRSVDMKKANEINRKSMKELWLAHEWSYANMKDTSDGILLVYYKSDCLGT